MPAAPCRHGQAAHRRPPRGQLQKPARARARRRPSTSGPSVYPRPPARRRSGGGGNQRKPSSPRGCGREMRAAAGLRIRRNSRWSGGSLTRKRCVPAHGRGHPPSGGPQCQRRRGKTSGRRRLSSAWWRQASLWATARPPRPTPSRGDTQTPAHEAAGRGRATAEQPPRSMREPVGAAWRRSDFFAKGRGGGRRPPKAAASPQWRLAAGRQSPPRVRGHSRSSCKLPRAGRVGGSGGICRQRADSEAKAAPIAGSHGPRGLESPAEAPGRGGHGGGRARDAIPPGPAGGELARGLPPSHHARPAPEG